MSGDNAADEAKLTGISKYFNATTLTGRANVSKATYAAGALLFLYFYLKPKKEEKTVKN